MGYTYKTDTGMYEAGNHLVRAVFEASLATKPFGLVQRDFNLEKFFKTHPDTGGITRDGGRVMDCLCRIDAVLLDQKNQSYPLLTPIIPTKVLYDINFDQPELFMKRIERWAIEHRRGLPIGQLRWDKEYVLPREMKQKLYECIDVLLNMAGMAELELIEASRLVLADETSTAELINPVPLIGHTFDLRSGQRQNIPIRYTQTGEILQVSIGTVAMLFRESRLNGVKLTIKGPLVCVTGVSGNSMATALR